MSACPVCGHRKTVVLASDHLRNGWTRRRRLCGHCQQRWNTYEVTQFDIDLSAVDEHDLAMVDRATEPAVGVGS